MLDAFLHRMLDAFSKTSTKLGPSSRRARRQAKALAKFSATLSAQPSLPVLPVQSESFLPPLPLQSELSLLPFVLQPEPSLPSLPVQPEPSLSSLPVQPEPSLPSLPVRSEPSLPSSPAQPKPAPTVQPSPAQPEPAITAQPSPLQPEPALPAQPSLVQLEPALPVQLPSQSEEDVPAQVEPSLPTQLRHVEQRASVDMKNTIGINSSFLKKSSLNATNNKNGIASFFLIKTSVEGSSQLVDDAEANKNAPATPVPPKVIVEEAPATEVPTDIHVNAEKAHPTKSLTINIALTKLADIENCIDDPTSTPIGPHISPKIARLRGIPSPVSRRPREGCERRALGSCRPPDSPLPSLILHRRQFSTEDLATHISTLTITLTNLVSIDLSRNQLTHLPAEFTRLTLRSLLHLNLASNQFVDFPDLSSFPNLRTLNLSQNSLSGSLPDPLPLQIPRLTCLNIAANAITRLPPTIARWTSLETLLLGSLIYGGNQLTAFPADTISSMRSLIELDVSHNLLTSLPADLGHKESRLLHLSAADNKITHFPSSLPRTLRSLNLHRNQITSLPCWITELVALQTLDLSENLLCILSAEVVTFLKGHTAVLTGNPFTRPGYCNLDGNKDLVKGLLRRGVVRKFIAYEGAGEDEEDERMDGMVLLALGGEKSRLETPLRVTGVVAPANGVVPPTVAVAAPVVSVSADEQDAQAQQTRPPRSPNPFLNVPKKKRRQRPRSLITAIRGDFRDLPTSSPSPCRLTPRLGALGETIKDNIEDATPAATPITPSFCPKTFLPSLVELCARQVLATSSPSKLPIHLIPEHTLSYLSSGARKCEQCGNVFVREYIAGVEVKGTEYGGMLVRGRFCSGECWRKHNKDGLSTSKQVLERKMCLGEA